MPQYYCNYCDKYLKHSSPFGRKQHYRGKNHMVSKIEYFKAFFQQQDELLMAQGAMPGMPPPLGFMPPQQNFQGGMGGGGQFG
mmetsp:Transcript_14583/g.24885  ORF Transcript_14583/g.24885 Transcript_14583/m.24885 type:complete len:83 (-) Transcript_14583:60-308(-)